MSCAPLQVTLKSSHRYHGNESMKHTTGHASAPAPCARPEALEDACLIGIALTDEQPGLCHLKVVLRISCHLQQVQAPAFSDGWSSQAMDH